MKYIPLKKEFYNKPTLNLAKALLGTILVSQVNDKLTTGYIVETEAYIGPLDQAAHSYKNRRTKRTEIMFHQAGLVYTYSIHTHTLFNIVSGDIDKPEAVLIRAIEPIDGTRFMKERRQNKNIYNLTSGPGKLTKAFGITMDFYGHNLTKNPLLISKGYKPKQISIGKRIGIDNSGEAKDYPWRFWITDNTYVSAHKREIESEIQ